MKLYIFSLEYKFSTQMNVLPTFQLVYYEMELMHQKASFMRMSKVYQHTSS